MMSPAGGEHGAVVMNVSIPVGHFVKSHQLGTVFGAETGFVIERNPDTVRAPDLAFIQSANVGDRVTQKFVEGAPDLAVEVLSPGDSVSQAADKAEHWLRSGCHEVWLIDPRHESASIWTVSGESVAHESVESLTSALLPGFALPVRELFA